MMGVASAIKIIAGIRLLTYKKRSSVRFAIAALWISDLGGMIAGFVLRSSILPETAGTIMQELNGPTMISLCTVGIWTAYLLRSKRVSNTYIR